MSECALFARLGRDPEMKHVKGGTLPLLTFTAVVDQQHQTEDTPATWVRVATFGDLAEQMAERLVKGVKLYVEGKLSVDLWEPGDGRAPRININVTATALQPIGQIGRQRPRQTRNVERHVTRNRAQAAGEAILAERDRQRDGPPQGWLDDTDAAVRDLEGAGR